MRPGQNGLPQRVPGGRGHPPTEMLHGIERLVAASRQSISENSVIRNRGSGYTEFVGTSGVGEGKQQYESVCGGGPSWTGGEVAPLKLRNKNRASRPPSSAFPLTTHLSHASIRQASKINRCPILWRKETRAVLDRQERVRNMPVSDSKGR